MKPFRLKPMWLILTCVLSSFLVISLLYAFSIWNYNHSNNFIRKLPPHVLRPLHILNIKYNSYYFAGQDNQDVYLGNSTAPNHLLKVNLATYDTASIKLNLPDIKLVPGYTRIFIENQDFVLAEGHTPVIIKGNLYDRQIKILDNNIYFISAKMMDPENLVVKTYDGSKANIGLFNLLEGKLSTNPNLLEKQLDGLFCTDGQLHTIPSKNKVVYIYRYRNEFIITDNHLNMSLKGRTIDTISKARIKLTKFDNGQTQFAAPPLVVNRVSTTSEKYLFINSGLKADNENRDAFNKYSVIDVYELSDASYQFSFYLPHFKGQKVNSLKTYQNNLLVMYDQYLIIYDMRF